MSTDTKATVLHPLGDTLLRTPETYERYHNHPKREAAECFICEAAQWRQYIHWHTIDNDFPYDAVAIEHRMLVPKRHVSTFEELNSKELLELASIRADLNKAGLFDCILENLAVGRTFMPHYHLHLIKWKRV